MSSADGLVRGEAPSAAFDRRPGQRADPYRRSLRQATWVALFLGVAQFAVQMSLLARGEAYVATSLTIDDTYYYLQTAWNTRQLGFVTFDGLHATNGVQFLWFVVVLGLAWLVKTKAALLVATLTVSFVLNGLCYLPILKIGAVLKQPALALFMASLWTLQSLPFRIYSMGMENSLHAFVVWCAVWQVSAFLVRLQNGQPARFWVLTSVLVLNAWARLDSALLSAILYGGCVAQWAYRHRGRVGHFVRTQARGIAGSSLMAGLALMVPFAAYRLMDGAFLPVSALIKTNGAARGLGAAAAQKFVEVFTLGMPAILQGRLPGLALVGLGVLAILTVARTRGAARPWPERAAASNLWLYLLTGELVYTVFVAVSGVEYTPSFIWHRSPSFVFWTLTAALIALWAMEQLGSLRFPARLLAGTPLSASLAIVAVAGYLFVRSVNFTSPLYAARYAAARWIANTTAPDTVLASWNAGQLGYYSNRTVINLDGLINSVDYYEQVLRGSRPLADYLSQNHVDYLVDYATYRSIPDYPVRHAFPIEDGSGRAIRVWQVSSPVASAP